MLNYDVTAACQDVEADIQIINVAQIISELDRGLIQFLLNSFSAIVSPYWNSQKLFHFHKF